MLLAVQIVWADRIELKQSLEILTFIGTWVGGAWALWTYNKSVRLEKAKWVKDLYEKFYERSDLKRARDLLDGDDKAKISDVVSAQSAEFTDYLNFFEFVGYLHKSKQISTDEVKGLFEYYLNNLRKSEQVARYIANPKNGFEHLQRLLGIVNRE